MNIAEPFIRRPVMTTLVMVAILLSGLVAYQLLPVSDLPAVDYPTVSVNASLPGGSPETMASSVATPLERQFTTIAGLDVMTSSSGQGTTSITLQFALDRNIDAAAADVQAAIAQTLGRLPRGIVPPSYSKVDPAAQPIFYLTLTSPSLSLSTLDDYGETTIAQRLSTLDGVAQVQVYGSQKYAVRVQLDPQSLAARRIGVDEVVQSISDANVNLPTGVLWGTDKAYTIEADGQLTNAAEFRALVVAYRDGAPVRLGDLGQVVDSVQETKSAAWYNGNRGIILAVSRQPGTNTVEVARRVRAEIARLGPELPASVQLNVLFDRSRSIEQSARDVQFTLFLTLCLVVLVIFLFLKNVSATIIPSLALPMSLIGTFGVMYLLNYSLDNLSLMALTLSVGFVVDDAIVMLENVVRHMEKGEKPLQAALNGSREIGFTIVSMTLSLVAVFIPVLFLGGLVGRLFHEFAVTIGVAILVSGIVSLTLTPMLCSRFLRPSAAHTDAAHHGKLYNATERGYQRVVGAYLRALGWVMAHRRIALAFSAGILVGTIWLAVVVPKGFIPSEDTGRIMGTTQVAEGTSFDAMMRHQSDIMDIVAKDPNVENFFVAVGGFRRTGNQARLLLVLKPTSERTLSADEIGREVGAKVNQLPGVQAFFQNPPAISIGGRGASSEYQYTLQGPDIDQLYRSAAQLETKLEQIPTIRDVSSDLQIRNPQVRLTVDRERAAAFGVTVSQVESALYDAYGGRQVSTIFTDTDQYWVILELLPQYQRDFGAFRLLSIRSPRGELVPLTALATVTPTVGPLTVNHTGQRPSVTLSFNLAAGTSIGDAVRAVDLAARQTLPDGVVGAFAGTAQAFESAQQGLMLLLLLAVAVIYIVLGILYESFIHPLTILSGLPFAGFGALLTLLIFGQDLSVYSFVGIIMLIGLVKKNAIMMIDFALEAERKQGKSSWDAIMEACEVRFRPIMMTTMAALMGTLPIAIGAGAGAEARRPLGLAVVGGLAFSQVVTLFVTPVIYTYLDELRFRFRRTAPGIGEVGGLSGPVPVPRSPR
jgi:hydrophobic/amphiphilic exporter-1 (mainly G- bacteria), HAE1 family